MKRSAHVIGVAAAAIVPGRARRSTQIIQVFSAVPFQGTKTAFQAQAVT